jgi:hypothetical protein
MLDAVEIDTAGHRVVPPTRATRPVAVAPSPVVDPFGNQPPDGGPRPAGEERRFVREDATARPVSGRMDTQMHDRIAEGDGFIAAPDQSGGSTPKALRQ